MQVESIRLETTINDGFDVPVIKASGEIDAYTVPDFRAALNRAIGFGAEDLIVDMTDIRYMDSSGFGALLGSVRKLGPEGGSVSLVGCNEAIARMLSITRLDTVFLIFPDLDTALEVIGDK